MKQTTIDTNILPKAWLNWRTSKTEYWVNCETNEKQEYRPNIVFNWNNKDNVLHYSGSKPHYAYMKYHEDIEMLEIATATFDTRRTAESHEWKYAGNKYFIDKSKNIYNEDGRLCEAGYTFYLFEHHYAYNPKNMLDMFIRLNYHENAMKEFHKLIGGETFTNATGKVYNAQYLWLVREWYIRKQKVNKKGKAGKLTDELTAIPLSDQSDLGMKYPPTTIRSNKYCYDERVNGIMYFERVNDEWSVLRMFVRETYDGKGIREIERMYLHDNGTNRIATPSGDTWIPAKQFCDYQKYQFINKDEAMEKCKRLKYIVPLFDKVGHIKRALMTTLKFPEVEQLIKLGYEEFAINIATSTTPKANMKHAFGEYYNEKGKNLLNKVGLTKHQLDKHLAALGTRNYYYAGSSYGLQKLREFFGEDLIHLDNKTFDKYYTAFYEIYYRAGTRFESYVDRTRVDKKKFIKNMVRLGNKHENVYTMIIDTMSMWLQLNYGTAPEIDWFFDSYSDAVRTHDAIMALKRMQDEERYARYNKDVAERKKKEEEKRIKLDEKRKELEYEDDEFIIRLPKDGNEIVCEGAKQHICIGGYVSDHSNGRTNLFFIRKKSKPDYPFYAIEMTNDHTINQIHGFGNKWLGNNPEAIPTVVRWLRKNGIKCREDILTCTATGYGSNGNYIPMPIVD